MTPANPADVPRRQLKEELFNRDKVAMIAAELTTTSRTFDASAFVSRVMSRLPELELKQRISWIVDCLEVHLPADYRAAVDLLVRSLPAPNDPAQSDGNLGDFIYAPYAEFAARHGSTRQDLDFSLAALREFTTRFSAEYALRTFIADFPEDTRATLLDWALDEHPHVRRLCSEGTRPLLPWATRLPTPADYAMPLLDRLHADRTRLVTRSVANHLNDISKLDAALALDTLRAWQHTGEGRGDELDYLVRHATRSLLKRGDPRSIELLGLRADAPVDISSLEIPEQVPLGSVLEFSLALLAREDTEVIADSVLYSPGTSGRLTIRRVYQLKRLRLSMGQPLTLTKRHRLRPGMTTLTIRPGQHELEVRLNGQPRARAAFRVTAATPAEA